MSEQLPPEYPFVHVYPQQKPRQPVIIKGNTEGIRSLIFALTSAIAYQDKHGVAEVFTSDAEFYQVLVDTVDTHSQLAPLPYTDTEQENETF